MKNDLPVDDFIRKLYKEDLLSLSEFNELKQKVKDLQSGRLSPKLQTITDAISS